MSPQEPPDGITAEGWPDETLTQTSSHGLLRRHSLLRHETTTGVRWGYDGRLDIKFHDQKANLASLLQQHLRKPREETAEEIQKASIPYPPSEKAALFPLRLNIVIHVVGSRGDVQPFIALGKSLKDHGHRVRLATHLAFKDFVHDNGLEFFDIGGDPAELMAFMVKNPGLMPGMKTIRSGAIGRRRREMKNIFTGCWRACYETGDGTGLHQIPDDPWSDTVDYRQKPFVADAIISNPPSLVHLSCAEKLGVPLNMMFTMPWTATQSFPHPLANVKTYHTKPTVANFASYAVVEMMIWEGLGDLINRFRRRELGLDPLDAIRAPSMAHKLRIPYTYLWSPALLPKPADWLENIDICGFAMLSKPEDYNPPEDLVAFLQDGPPPVYIGFGSIVVDNSAKLTQVVFDAVRLSGQRALVSKGWGNIGGDGENIPDNIHMLGSVPHDWLFKQVSCVVHHGGAGTTAAGLALGRPTVIIPFFGDQPFWGAIVHRAGAGPAPIPYKHLTAERLAAAIIQALEQETQDKAKEIGEKMINETGVRCATASFHRHLDLDSLRCSICPRRPAVWWVRHSHIKLSAFAATVLVEAGLVKPHDCVLYRSHEYDTNRDPRGPLSAGAEILYGVVSDFVSGVANLPSDMVGVLHHHHHHHHHHKKHHHHHYHQSNCNCPKCGEVLSRLANGLPPEAKSQSHSDLGPQAEMDVVRSGDEASVEGSRSDREEGSINGSDSEDSGSYTSAPDRLSGEGSDFHSGSDTVQDESSTTHVGESSDEGFGEALDLETTITRQMTKEPTGTEAVLLETSYHGRRWGKQFLKALIVLPTDITLSLSKGFHNAPLLYNDDTVKPTPKVMGVRSGFRAAGTEFTQGFFYGITGLVTLPAEGYNKSGARGLLRGIGRGIGGVFLKPTAGIWGLMGYPLDGMHKSLRNSLSKNKTKDILSSRMQQGIDEMVASTPDERAMIIRRWHELENELNGGPELSGM